MYNVDGPCHGQEQHEQHDSFIEDGRDGVSEGRRRRREEVVVLVGCAESETNRTGDNV